MVVIGLGANLGDRLGAMRAAVKRVAEHTTLRACSDVYETAPVGVLDQPPFLNAAILVECMLSPEALLDVLLTVERDAGRVRSEDRLRWGPRTLDLDILWIEGVAVDTERLEVPHPRLRERAFALVPLLDVAPDAKDPTTGAPYTLLLPGDAVVGDVRRTELALAPLVQATTSTPFQKAT